MELPRPSLVKHLALYLSPEGRGIAYLLADRVSGGVSRLTRASAQSFARFSRAATGDPAARAALREDDARTGFMILQMCNQARKFAERGAPRFNPLSIHLELLDVGLWQHHVSATARHVFGPAGAAFFVFLMVAAALLGMRNDWSAATAFQDSMTLEAFLTFGIAMPFLKIIHEMGHVMAADVCGVRVRQGGVNLIAFYPMPFVDCSEADLICQRPQRMLISLAGVLVDSAIGLISFILWHFVDDGQTKDVLGYVFVFSTMNSLLFNANPLMRMDGYFVMSDILGWRNLGTDSTAIQKAAVSHLKSLGAAGHLPVGRAEWGALVYSVAAMFYRVMVLIGIMWVTMPQFFGIGFLATAWSAWALFGGKIMSLDMFSPEAPSPEAAQATTPEKPGPLSRLPRGSIWTGSLLAFVLFMLIPISPSVLVDLRPDSINTYDVTNIRAGLLMSDIPRNAVVRIGTPLATLENKDLSNAAVLSKLAVAEARIMEAISQGAGAAQIEAGSDRVSSAQAIHELALSEEAALQIKAPRSGQFIAAEPFMAGSYLKQGTVLGQILPQNGQISLIGTFPENYIVYHDYGLHKTDLWTGKGYRIINPNRVVVTEQIRQDAAATTRGFTLRIETEVGNLSPFPQVRLSFASIPIWRHALLWVNGKLAAFRDAQLSETERRIEN